MASLRADLHTHTCYSDGQLTPAALVEKAQQRGLKALAVTDHDTIGGLEEAMAAGEAFGVDIVTGVELSVTIDGEEIHLLGYLFNPNDRDLKAHLRSFLQARRIRAERIVERLNGLGVPLHFEAVLEQVGDAEAIGRPHVAAALEAAGFVDSRQAAFDEYLQDGGPAWVAKPQFPAAEALALLHAAGGIGVLAHPGHWTSTAQLRKLVRTGLDGIEVVHPAHDESLTRYYRRKARYYDLVATGGSDYHGHRARDEANFGAYHVPLECLEQMRCRVA